MQPLCADVMKTARELLDHGILNEGAEKLLELRGCSCKAGCDDWHRCINLVENQWRLASVPTRQKPAAGRS